MASSNTERSSLCTFSIMAAKASDFSLVFLIIIAFIAAPRAYIIIRMAISRTREFGADKTGAEISGNPLALASALEKIERYSKVPMNVNPAVSQLFISDPLKAFSGNSFSKLFSTHPPTIERVRRLRQTQSGIRY